MNSSHSEDSRRHPRTAVDCRVHLQPLDTTGGDAADCSYDGLALDISISGMALWTDRFYPLNTRAMLSFECEQCGEHRVTSCIVTVVWSVSTPVDGRWRLGVKFNNEDGNPLLATQGCIWCERLNATRSHWSDHP